MGRKSKIQSAKQLIGFRPARQMFPSTISIGGESWIVVEEDEMPLDGQNNTCFGLTDTGARAMRMWHPDPCPLHFDALMRKVMWHELTHAAHCTMYNFHNSLDAEQREQIAEMVSGILIPAISSDKRWVKALIP